MKRRAIVVAGLLAVFLAVVVYRTATATPDRMWKWQLEAWLSQQIDMSNVSLIEHDPGQFTGTAMKNGKAYQLRVTRETGRVSWDYSPEDPARSGEIGSGSMSWSP